MTTQNEIRTLVEQLDAVLTDLLRDPNMPYREQAHLATAKEILQPILAIPQTAFQLITPPTKEWQPASQYEYFSKSSSRELRIPYTDITVKELSYFVEVICDADAQIVRVRI